MELDDTNHTKKGLTPQLRRILGPNSKQVAASSLVPVACHHLPRGAAQVQTRLSRPLAKVEVAEETKVEIGSTSKTRERASKSMEERLLSRSLFSSQLELSGYCNPPQERCGESRLTPHVQHTKTKVPRNPRRLCFPSFSFEKEIPARQRKNKEDQQSLKRKLSPAPRTPRMRPDKPFNDHMTEGFGNTLFRPKYSRITWELPQYNLADLPKSIKEHCEQYGVSQKLMEEYTDVLFRVCKFLFPKEKFPNPISQPRETSEVARRRVSTSILNVGRAVIQEPPKHLKKMYKSQYLHGKGGYGRVYSAKEASTKHRVAVKILSQHTETVRINNQCEAGFLALCSHPNIVKFRDAWQYKDEKKRLDEIWIVTEFLSGGTLSQAAKTLLFTEANISYVARAVLNGMKFLHDRKWAHRDIKSANIMMDIYGVIKLIDFGLCADMSEGPVKKMLGSPFWIPPEMILRIPHDISCDVWSFAVCLLELYLGHPPHYTSSAKCMFYTATIGLADQIPARASPQAKDFLRKCLLLDPTKRATADELLAHPWVNQQNMEEGIESLFRTVFLNAQITNFQF